MRSSDPALATALAAFLAPLLVGAVMSLISATNNNGRLRSGLADLEIGTQEWHDRNLRKMRHSLSAQVAWIFGGAIVGLLGVIAVIMTDWICPFFQ